MNLIEEVYEKFFELLPEEELLTLDILENILSFTSWEESPKVEEIYEDLFEQVKRKRKFSTNDLLVIDTISSIFMEENSMIKNFLKES